MSKDADAFDNRFKILLTGDRCIAIIPATRLPCSVPRLRGACRVVVLPHPGGHSLQFMGRGAADGERGGHEDDGSDAEAV